MEIKRFKGVIYISFVAIFYIIIFLKTDFIKIIHYIYNLNINLFLVSLSISIPYFLLIGKRWKLLMNTQNINYSYKESLVMYTMGYTLGVITPGKLGELIKFYYLKKDGYPLFKSIIVILLDRGIDLVLLLIIASVSLFKLLHNIVYISILLIIIFAILIFIVSANQKLLDKFINGLIPKKVISSAIINYNKLYVDFEKPSLYQSCLIIALSFAITSTSFIGCYLLAYSLNIDISFIDLVACYSVSTVVALIPISIYGIGIRDISMITLFSIFGLSKESAIAFSTLCVICYLLSGLICGIILSFTYGRSWFSKAIDV